VKKLSRFSLFVFIVFAILSCQMIPLSPGTPTVMPTQPPVEITDSQGIPMRLIPAGEFMMGSDSDDDHLNSLHTLHLDAYYIDKYEVTNARYAECVNAGVCDPPHETKSEFHPEYFGNSQFDDHPVVYVDWNMARTYCSWREARLPTEAEWEKAARGTDGRTYPWGEAISCDKANYDSCVGETTKVGSYESGQSPYGLYDMAGNVFEWVSSINKIYPYDATDGREDLTLGSNRVIRGGGWSHTAHDVQTFYRSWIGPNYSESVIGFRCAKDANL
jgi:formylglycine-generating enzyme required for sulfatase activity